MPVATLNTAILKDMTGKRKSGALPRHEQHVGGRGFGDVYVYGGQPAPIQTAEVAQPDVNVQAVSGILGTIADLARLGQNLLQEGTADVGENNSKRTAIVGRVGRNIPVGY